MIPRFALFLVLASLALVAPAQGECRRRALDALRDAPDGAAIYRQISDKAFFRRWIDCEDATLGLPTAIHESTHFIAAERDAFPLIGGGEVGRPHEVSGFYPPSQIAEQFGESDFVDTYLKAGRASSATDFLYLLDELNAYSHDLNAAVDLKHMRRPDRIADSRDGLAALMAFVALYVETARRDQPATWEGLRQTNVTHTLTALWGQAEKVMTASCGLSNFGTQDKAFLRQAYEEGARAALGVVIARLPVTPEACLKASADELDSAEAVERAAVRRADRRRATLHAAVSDTLSPPE